MNPQHFCLLLLFTVASLQTGAQQTLLFNEDFEQSSHAFSYDSGWVNDSGANRWIVNNSYAGDSVYPATIGQDSPQAGTITNAPFSAYLHIHDELAAGVANASFNPAAPSDRFIYTSNGFCTSGMTDVVVAFFYLCQGNANAWGEVYYSVDGGAWVQTGAPKYQNQPVWKYEIISDSAFNNIANLRLGFRWVNDSSALPATTAFAIDDILSVGVLNTAAIQLTIPFVPPDPVCRNSIFTLQWSLSAPLCDGSYRIELSSFNGDFQNPQNVGTFSVSGGDTSGYISIQAPGNLPTGNCYKVRMLRLNSPLITGIPSNCFRIENCANTITALMPIVTIDPDTLCALSAIDVPFLSSGVFNANNSYIAQLSDSAGNFINPQQIGTLPNRETYDPSIGAMPGNVSGVVPGTPEGCNYFIRVISTHPPALSSLYGPFCIKQCDVTTNNSSNVHVCIHETTGTSDTISIDVHEWNNTAIYSPGNSFVTQLLDPQTLSVVNEGALGAVITSASTTMTLTVPGLTALTNAGIAPGNYYLRMIADSSSQPWNSMGTIIRLTIGAIADSPPVIIPNKAVYCNNEIGELLITPYNTQSDYMWWSSVLNNGIPFDWPINPLRIDLSGAAPGGFTFRVQEINYGCEGGYSAGATVYVIDPPSVEIAGLQRVCADSILSYTVPFFENTYYEWSVTGANMIDTANNEITISFPAPGTAELSIYVLNACGFTTADYTVQASGGTSSIASLPQIFCLDDSPVTLSATPAGGVFAGTGVTADLFSPDLAGVGTHQILYVAVDSAGCNLKDTATVTVEVCPGILSASSATVNVYPNPAAETLYVDFRGAVTSREINVQLFNTAGKVVQSAAYQTAASTPTLSIDLTQLPSGIYMLRINNESQQLRKVVVLR